MGPKKKQPEEEEEPEVDPMDVVTMEDYHEKATPYFEELYADCDCHMARDCSRKEREENEHTDASLAYGEILWDPFAAVFLKLKSLYGFREVGGKFVDIGSGTAKPVFGAALLHKFEDCVGIEILEGLHQLAEERLAKWNAMITENENLERKKHVIITLTHGDATVIEWSDADVVFINSTCFEDSLLEKLAAKASDLKPGSFVFTVTKPLPSVNFEILETDVFKECWGKATIYFHRRKNLSE